MMQTYGLQALKSHYLTLIVHIFAQSHFNRNYTYLD